MLLLPHEHALQDDAFELHLALAFEVSYRAVVLALLHVLHNVSFGKQHLANHALYVEALPFGHADSFAVDSIMRPTQQTMHKSSSFMLATTECSVQRTVVSVTYDSLLIASTGTGGSYLFRFPTRKGYSNIRMPFNAFRPTAAGEPSLDSNNLNLTDVAIRFETGGRYTCQVFA